MLGSGSTFADGIAAGIKSGSNHVEITMNSLFMKVKTPNLNKQTLYSEGRNVAEGLARGIRAGESDVINAVARVCSAAVSEARRKLDIHSPSKVFEKLGAYTAEGFGIGYGKQMQNVNGVIRSSLEIPDIRERTGTSGNTSSGGIEKLVIETANLYRKYLQPYGDCGNCHGRIFQEQTGRLSARGLSLNGI